MSNPLGDVGSIVTGGLGAAGSVQGMQNAGNLQNLSNSAIPYANQILQTGFDPQNALYNRTAGQVMDSGNAINSMNGIAGTPYGAGEMNRNMNNFNINWQNNLLNREKTAAGGFDTLASGIGGLSNSAFNQNQKLGENFSGGIGGLLSGAGGLFGDLFGGGGGGGGGNIFSQAAGDVATMGIF